MVINLSAPVNWQPKLGTLISVAAGFVMLHPEDFVNHPWVGHLAGYMLLTGISVLGLTVKQGNVTGGNVVNSGNDPAKVTETHSVKT